MAFDVSTLVGYIVLSSVLGVFTVLAAGAGGWFPCLPPFVSRCCFLVKSTSKTTAADHYEHFLSARNSAGTTSIALSFFASGMGAWVLYGTTEMGANPELSWIAVLGYSAGSALPAILIGIVLGPTIRERSAKAFSTTDFGHDRYGRIMQVTIACVSGFYMFLFIVAELTAISLIYAKFTNNNSSPWYGIAITVAVGAVTVLYTILAGLPASIVTDKFQGLIIIVLVIVLTAAVTTHSENRISVAEFKAAGHWTTEGGMAAVTLIVAIASAELFNQGTWQRVWAAESIPVMRRGFALGSILVFALMMFFGVCGMMAYAKDPTSYDSDPPTKVASMAFFDLLEPLDPVWHILTLILVTALTASSVDSLQNGLTAIFTSDLVKMNLRPQSMSRLLWTILLICLNAPAVWLASEQYSVVSLFLVADLVCATSVFPVFLGLQTEDYGVLRAPTELGAFFGCLAGIASVVVNGILVDAEGGLFEYFWLRNDGICLLCGPNTMITFIVTPAVSFVATYMFSFLDVLIRGERARRPLFHVPFDDEDKEIEDKETEEYEDNERQPETLESEEADCRPSWERQRDTVESDEAYTDAWDDNGVSSMEDESEVREEEFSEGWFFGRYYQRRERSTGT